MALDNKTLNDFFNKKNGSTTVNDSKNSSVNKNTAPNVRHFKVFDDPTRVSEINEEIIECKQSPPSMDEATIKPDNQIKNNTVNEDVDPFPKGVYRPLSPKGCIDPFPKGVYRPLSKGVYRPLSPKGCIDPFETYACKLLQDLRGNPLIIAKYLFSISVINSDKITEKTSKFDITKNTGISKDSVKTAIKFLIENKLIEKIETKAGNGGWIKYKMEPSLYDEMSMAFRKGSIDPFPKGVYTPLSSKGSNSSSSININTTTKNQPLSILDEIDILPLEHIGLTKKHLLQLKGCEAEIIQESINHFAYGLKFSEKTKKYNDPLSVFMGVLRKKEVWIEANYKSSYEIAREELIKHKKNEQERLKKLEEEAYSLALLEWQQKLTKEELEKISPTHKATKDITPHSVKISSYFKENIWPNEMANYLVEK